MSTWLANLFHLDRARDAERVTFHPRDAGQVRFADLAWDHFYWDR